MLPRTVPIAETALPPEQIRIRRFDPDAACRFDEFVQTDINDRCLRCGAADGEDCRDV